MKYIYKFEAIYQNLDDRQRMFVYDSRNFEELKLKMTWSKNLI